MSANCAINLQQVWFSGAHADVGGSTPPDKRRRNSQYKHGALLSDIAFQWIMQQAAECGLSLKRHMVNAMYPNALGKKERAIPSDHPISSSVKRRQDAIRSYKPKPLMDYLSVDGWNNILTVKKPKVIA